jgi:putative flippase GtrA
VRSASDLIHEAGRIIRFGIVGIAATAVYASSAFLAIEALHVPPVRGSVIAQLAATGVSYFGHTLYSFRVKLDHRTYLWRFVLIAAVAFAVNVAVTWLLAEALGLSYRVTIAAVTILIPIVNYVCNRFWVFMPGLLPLTETTGTLGKRSKNG